MSDTWVDRNHKVSSESWDGIHTRHYPMHHVPLVGWRYYTDRTSREERYVFFLFLDSAVRHLKTLIENGR